jgi:hypothetical protein
MAEFECEIRGRVPSKKNSRVVVRATGRNFPSGNYDSWHRSCMRELVPLAPAKPFGVCVVTVCIFFGDKRRADVTNKAESVLDLLVDAGVIEDDCWTKIGAPILRCDYRKNDPGFAVRVVGV